MSLPKNNSSLGKQGRFPADLDCDNAIRHLVSEGIKQSPKSREQIAEEMGFLTGQEITVRMLNDYSADSKAHHRFPASFMAAFCHATGDTRLAQFIANKLNLALIDAHDVKTLLLGKAIADREAADREANELAAEVLAERGRR